MEDVPEAEPPANGFALTRTLVMRMTREFFVPGARIGIPRKVTELPLTRPWNTFLPATGVAAPGRNVTPAVSVATGIGGVVPGWVAKDTNSAQPVNGVVQRFCGAAGPKPGTNGTSPEPGSSSISRASDT